jgi:hypothetical protein
MRARVFIERLQMVCAVVITVVDSQLASFSVFACSGARLIPTIPLLEEFVRQNAHQGNIQYLQLHLALLLLDQLRRRILRMLLLKSPATAVRADGLTPRTTWLQPV